jgi:hypothetical protein
MVPPGTPTMTSDLVVVLAAVWNEGVSLAPQVISFFRLLHSAVNS